MIQQINDQGLFDGSVQIVQPIPEGSGDVLNEQGGLYTVQLHGLGNDCFDQRQLISCVRGSLNAYRDWQSVLDLAGEETLRFVFSNTTEAGIEYVPEPWQRDQTPTTFPAKLTAFLFERFQKIAEKYGNEPGRGLIVIPCESVERSASKLKSCVLRYANDWKLADDFVQPLVEKYARWIEHLRQGRLPNFLKLRYIEYSEQELMRTWKWLQESVRVVRDSYERRIANNVKNVRRRPAPHDLSWRSSVWRKDCQQIERNRRSVGLLP